MLPTLADFFLAMLYVLVGSIVLSAAIMIVGAGLVEVRKRWGK